MYRRLKNILGVSMMIMAIVISQIPMPETQAETVKEMTEKEMQVDDASAHVVTFSMNGGTFKGDYNGYRFQDKTPVLVIDNGRKISSFPDDKYASYVGYKTEADTWYTDQECLTKYDTSDGVNKSMTLYKKWYNITSDGTTLASKGFHISADGTVLYRYDGEETLVEIPQTVTTIAKGAFDDLSPDVRGITLPAHIEMIDENAFQGVADTNIVYIYDSDTTVSKDYGKKLADQYEQLVYSEYLDPQKTEKIVGIHLLSDALSKKSSVTPEGDRAATGVNDSSTKPSNGGDSTNPTKESSKSSESSPESSGDEENSKTEEKTNTVTFQMNGGGFTGTYSGTSYTDAASLTTKITAGRAISSSEYPENSSSSDFRYSNYTTDTNWYKDKECLVIFDKNTVVDGDITLYKKWYHTSSGFTMNVSDSVLYKYSGSVENVTIPNTVTVIGSDAFASVGGISGITLPDNISDVKENAFSGVNKVSKEITITGKTEKSQNMAKELARQYTGLVYEDSKLSQEDDSVVISREASGSIKLGATLSGSAGTVGNSTASAASNDTSGKGTIVLGANGASAAATTTSDKAITVSPSSADSQSAAVSQNTTTPAGQDPSGSTASATQKQNVTSASAPKSTQHIKDSTPKTGDPLQYRMLLVCILFSVGVLLVLTGNGKRKRFSAS